PGTDDYRPIQDLQPVNQATITIHPVVPNLYALQGFIPAKATFFTCLNLKDAFFCIHMAPQSQSIFAFQWESPKNGDKGQLTWTRLLQGLKNSPTIFGIALASDLKAFPADQYGCVLFQYVDDLLLARRSQEDSMEGTQQLLTLLWETSYKASRKKAQICQEKINYLGFHLSQGQFQLSPERKQAVSLTLVPST
ncbi:pol polyprotein precursor, partial [Lynx pardinus]